MCPTPNLILNIILFDNTTKPEEMFSKINNSLEKDFINNAFNMIMASSLIPLKNSPNRENKKEQETGIF